MFLCTRLWVAWPSLVSSSTFNHASFPFCPLMLLLVSLGVVLLMPPAQGLLHTLFMFLTSIPASLRHYLNPSGKLPTVMTLFILPFSAIWTHGFLFWLGPLSYPGREYQFRKSLDQIGLRVYMSGLSWLFIDVGWSIFDRAASLPM